MGASAGMKRVIAGDSARAPVAQGRWNVLTVLTQRFSPPVLWLLGVLVLFLGAAIAHVVAFVVLEGAPLGEALWATWQTFSTVGYEDRPVPGTLTRIVVAVVSTAGVIAVGALLTGLIEVRQAQAERRRFGQMDNPMKGGYVIVNFPGEHLFDTFVDELRVVEPKVPLCIVDGNLTELPPASAAIPGVHFVRGQLLERETYTRARLQDAKAVIVFPQRWADPASDGATRTIVDLVVRLAGPSTRVMHVLVSPKNYWLFEGLRSTPVLGSFEILALVQECQDPYSAPIVEDLFRNSVGPRPITVPVGAAAGLTWSQFLHGCVAAGAELDAHMMPWALIRDGKPDLTPSASTVLQKGDLLSFITNDGATWEAFEPRAVALARAP